MATEVTDLPSEVLVYIFSYLNMYEVHNAAIVCSKFNEASKHPSLWSKCKIVFVVGADDFKVFSFCNFFMHAPSCLRELSIHTAAFANSKLLSKLHLQTLRLLFKNLTHLHCLNTDINLNTFVIPPSLRHLQCRVNGTFKNKEMTQFSFLENCPNIERLFMTVKNAQYLCFAFESLFLKYQLTLTSFWLKTDYFDNKWIAYCKNLKELGIHKERKVLEMYFSNSFGGSVFSSLEILVLRNVGLSVPHFLRECVFPELKHLTIASAQSSSLQVCLLSLNNKIPKLQAFCFSVSPVCKLSNYPADIDVSNLFYCLESCETLRYVVIDNKYSNCSGERGLKSKIQKFNTDNSIENQWKVSYPVREETLVLSSYMCYCWEPSKNPLKNYIDRNQRTMLLKHRHSRIENTLWNDL